MGITDVLVVVGAGVAVEVTGVVVRVIEIGEHITSSGLWSGAVVGVAHSAVVEIGSALLSGAHSINAIVSTAVVSAIGGRFIASLPGAGE